MDKTIYNFGRNGQGRTTVAARCKLGTYDMLVVCRYIKYR